MHLAVVEATEETEIVDHGLASIEPGDDVVDVAPPGRASATGSDAMAITGDHCPTQTGRDHPGLAADVEHFGSGAEHDPRHRGSQAS